MGERMQENGMDQPEESALERPIVAPKSGLLSRLAEFRKMAGALMLGAVIMPDTAESAEKNVPTQVEARSKIVEIAIIKYHPKDPQRPILAKFASGATTNIQLPSASDAKKRGQFVYDPATKKITYHDYNGDKIIATVVDEAQLTKPFNRQDLKREQQNAAAAAAIVRAPTEQGVPATPLEESPLEEEVSFDHTQLNKVYAVQRPGAEYSCDIPAVTVEKNGEGIRGPSTVSPTEWKAESIDVTVDLTFQAQGEFTWSYLMPLPPDAGDRKRILSEIDVDVGEIFKSKRSFVTDVIVTRDQAFARITMRGFSAKSITVPVTIHMHNWMAVPHYQNIPTNVSEPALQKAMHLRQASVEKPKKAVPIMETEYERFFAPKPENERLARERLAEAGSGYIVMGVQDGKQIQHRYVTPGHVTCNTGVYAVNDPSFIPLAVASHGHLPKVEGLYDEFDSVATPFGRFLKVQGKAYAGPSIRSGELSATTSKAGEKEEAPAWVSKCVKAFSESRQKINNREQIAAADKAAPQD